MKLLGIVAASLLIFAVFGAGSIHAQSGTVTATVRPNPLRVDITAPSTIPVNQWFTVTADITNQGQDPISQTVVTLNAPAEIKIKSSRKKIGTLAAHQTTNLNWQTKATVSGNFVIIAEATGKLFGETISSQDSAVITTTGTLGAFLFKLILGV